MQRLQETKFSLFSEEGEAGQWGLVGDGENSPGGKAQNVQDLLFLIKSLNFIVSVMGRLSGV